jgi:hypothetical protein
MGILFFLYCWRAFMGNTVEVWYRKRRCWWMMCITVDNMGWCCDIRDVLNVDTDENVYHSEQHELMLCLSISLMKLITYNVFGKYGSLSFFHYFWTFACIFLPFLHRPITAMGDIFQWVVRFQPVRSAAIFPCFICSAGCERLIQHEMLTTQAKNISEDFIDFWFNCVRLLNHVKANPRQAFYTRMKSVISDLIGPFSCLSSVNVPHFAVWSLQGSASLWLVGTGSGFP